MAQKSNLYSEEDLGVLYFMLPELKERQGIGLSWEERSFVDAAWKNQVNIFRRTLKVLADT
jgi:hypothetical protein